MTRFVKISFAVQQPFVQRQQYCPNGFKLLNLGTEHVVGQVFGLHGNVEWRMLNGEGGLELEFGGETLESFELEGTCDRTPEAFVGFRIAASIETD